MKGASGADKDNTGKKRLQKQCRVRESNLHEETDVPCVDRVPFQHLASSSTSKLYLFVHNEPDESTGVEKNDESNYANGDDKAEPKIQPLTTNLVAVLPNVRLGVERELTVG